jgi:hypothetical protein
MYENIKKPPVFEKQAAFSGKYKGGVPQPCAAPGDFSPS